MNPIPYAEQPQDVFNPSANPSGVNPDGTLFGDWLEMIDTTSPADGNASIDGQLEHTLTGLVPFNKVRSAMRWFLGFAYVDQSRGWLIRENPVIHPVHPQCRCSSFSYKPYIPSPQIVVLVQAENGNPAILGPSLSVGSPFVDVSGSNKTLLFASYKYAIVTVKFTGFRYQFLGDSQVRPNSIIIGGAPSPVPDGWGGNEWMRNTYVDLNPRLESLSAEGTSYMAFDETSAPVVGPPAIPAGPVVGTKVPVPQVVLLGKSAYVLKWFSVPVNYISQGTGVFYPANILENLGYVNSVPFLGFDPETILLKAPTFDFKPYCVPAIDGTPMLQVDVSIPLEYFQPENGNPTSTHAGWQLFPWRANGLFYHMSRITPGGVAPNGVGYLPSTDLNVIFDNPNFD